jgi:NAD(P)H-dependent FMN reductase
MRSLVLSSSLDPASRSEQLARIYADSLSAHGVEVQFLSLKDFPLPRFDDTDRILADASYRALHEASSNADGLVLASPVYNWSCCAELKRFVEVVGTNPPGQPVRSPFFDKIVTFVNAAGLPQSYMAWSSLAFSMMLDFKCVVNPYVVYADNSCWSGNVLGEAPSKRLRKSAAVMAEMMRCLAMRDYRSGWEI